MYHQYLKIMANYIIDNRTGESLEYTHLIKRDKHTQNGWNIVQNGLVEWHKEY